MTAKQRFSGRGPSLVADDEQLCVELLDGGDQILGRDLVTDVLVDLVADPTLFQV